MTTVSQKICLMCLLRIFLRNKSYFNLGCKTARAPTIATTAATPLAILAVCTEPDVDLNDSQPNSDANVAEYSIF